MVTERSTDRQVLRAHQSFDGLLDLFIASGIALQALSKRDGQYGAFMRKVYAAKR